MPTTKEFSYRNEMDHLRKDMASLSGELEDAETQNLKLKRELNEALLTVSSLTGENSRLAKSKSRTQFDFEEALNSLAMERASIQDLANKFKKLNKDLNLEKNATMSMQAERDDALAALQASEAKCQAADDKARAAERKAADVESEMKQVKLSAHSMFEKKHRAEQMVDEMEVYTASLDRRLTEQKEEIAALSNETKNKEAALRGMDMALSTAKSMAAAESAKMEEAVDTLQASLTKANRIQLQTEGELQTALQAAANSKRMAEQQIAVAEQEIGNLKMQNDELMSAMQKLKKERGKFNGPRKPDVEEK